MSILYFVIYKKLTVLIVYDNLFSMKTEDIEKELQKVLSEAKTLKEKSDVQLATSKFLDEESKKLIKKITDPLSTPEEIEETAKQLYALKKRLEIELSMFQNDAAIVISLNNRLEKLKKLSKECEK